MNNWIKKKGRQKNILHEKAESCDQHKSNFKQDKVKNFI